MTETTFTTDGTLKDFNLPPTLTQQENVNQMTMPKVKRTLEERREIVRQFDQLVKEGLNQREAAEKLKLLKGTIYNYKASLRNANALKQVAGRLSRSLSSTALAPSATTEQRLTLDILGNPIMTVRGSPREIAHVIRELGASPHRV